VTDDGSPAVTDDTDDGSPTVTDDGSIHGGPGATPSPTDEARRAGTGDAADAWTGLAVEVAAGGAAVGASFAVAGLSNAFVAAPVAAALTVAAPGAAVTFAIQRLGDLGQPLLFAGALGLTVLALAAATWLGVAAAGRLVPNSTTAPPLAAGLATGGLALGLTRAPLASLAAGLAAGAVLALGRTAVATGGSPTDPSTFSPGRRGLLRAIAGALAVVGLGGLVGARPWTDGPASSAALGGGSDAASGSGDGSDGAGAGTGSDPAVAALLSAAADRSLDVEGIEPLVSRSHYQVDINAVDPTIDPDEWTLSVTGAVDEERRFTFEDLTSLPAEHRFVTLRCVGEKLNGEKTDTALWTGVPVTELLGDDLPDECCVMFRAADDFYEEFPLSALEDALLAYRMNGRPLPKAHGRPVRALIPGHWGEINVKWLTEIEILTEEQDGYWEKRGWHGTGPVNTVAKLHGVTTRDDGTIEVGGHAYAGTRGIERVEVSTDGGETWTEADLSEPLPGRVRASTARDGGDGSGGAADDEGDAGGDASPDPAAFVSGEATDAWRMWRHVYEAAGEHEVVVRAVDGTGTLQPEERADAFPSGPTGWVSKTVRP